MRALGFFIHHPLSFLNPVRFQEMSDVINTLRLAFVTNNHLFYPAQNHDIGIYEKANGSILPGSFVNPLISDNLMQSESRSSQDDI